MPLPEPPPAGTPMFAADALAGHVAVVTGGGTGLGRAIALELARAGAAIGIVSRDPEHRANGVAAIQEIGGTVADAACDVREADQVEAAFAAIEAALGTPTILINNAAANFPVLAKSISPNAWRAVNRIVVDGTFFCSQQLHQRVVAAGVPGSIVNIVATQSFTGGPGMAHAAAAKAAVVNMTKSLAVEWAPDGVRVNAIAPGLFPHEEMRDDLKALRTSGEAVDATRSPALRLGQRREIGWAATWLSSPFANFITGHTLVVDGANWLRRDFVMPPFTPLDEQLSAVLRPKDD
jgi:NAD(P)-dependent dehydrogenase (short-subunit alcohol dehydrogenase family)